MKWFAQLMSLVSGIAGSISSWRKRRRDVKRRRKEQEYAERWKNTP